MTENASVLPTDGPSQGDTPPAKKQQRTDDEAPAPLGPSASHSGDDPHTATTGLDTSVPCVSQGCPNGLLCEMGPIPRARWEQLVLDTSRDSHAFLLRARDTGLAPFFPRWYNLLQPQACKAWTNAHYRGKRLLRSTAWWVQSPCECAYVYSDTHQPVAVDPSFDSVMKEITGQVVKALGLQTCPPNSANLNYYPPGLWLCLCLAFGIMTACWLSLMVSRVHLLVQCFALTHLQFVHCTVYVVLTI